MAYKMSFKVLSRLIKMRENIHFKLNRLDPSCPDLPDLNTKLVFFFSTLITLPQTFKTKSA